MCSLTVFKLNGLLKKRKPNIYLKLHINFIIFLMLIYVSRGAKPFVDEDFIRFVEVAGNIGLVFSSLMFAMTNCLQYDFLNNSFDYMLLPMQITPVIIFSSLSFLIPSMFELAIVSSLFANLIVILVTRYMFSTSSKDRFVVTEISEKRAR